MKKCLLSALVCAILAVGTTTAVAQINLTFSSVSPTCFGYTNGSATAIPADGMPPYAFTWENGQTGPTNLGLGAGVYWVTVTDANSQTASGSVEVSQPDPFVAEITGANISCNGVSGTLTANGVGGPQPYGYSWSTSETTQSISVAGPNIYYVTVMDANGCADAANFTVPTSTVLDVLVTNIPCASDPNGGALNATVTGGAPPFSFVWDDGNTSPSRQNMPAGTYTVTVTGANGCTAVDQGTITMPTPLEVTAISITPSCGGANSGAATVFATGGTGPYTHTWTPGGYTGSTVTGLAPGQYYVCTFDANHCQKDLWVIIPEITGLQVNLAVLSAECTGVDDGVVTALVTPPGSYEYQWNLPPFTGVTQLTGLAANTVVSVTVTDPISGCTGTATTTVGAHNAITLNVVDTDIPCQGQNIGTATAEASGGTPVYNYQWLTPPSGPQIGAGATITGLAPGAYMVSVTDSRGCTAIGAADIGILSAPQAIIGGLNVVECGAVSSLVSFVDLSTDQYGTLVSNLWTITPQNGAPQTFSNQNTVQLDLPVGQTGTVTLLVTSSNGCTSTVTQPYSVPGQPNISLNVGATAVDCQNDPIHLEVIGGQPGYVYTWSPMTGLTLDPVPPNATANPATTTTYQLVASNQGCTDTVSVEVMRVTPIELSVESNEVGTCDSTFVLLAQSNITNVIWIDAQGNPIGTPPANPITVVAGATAIYTAIATDTNGCIDSVQVSVTGESTAVLVDAQLPLSGCVNTNIQLGLTNLHPGDILTYQWSVPAPLVISGATLPNPSVSGPAGSYVVTVTVSNQYDCSQVLEIPIQIDEMTSINQSISADLCSGTVVTFTNTSGLPGTWTFGDNTTSNLDNPVHTYASAGNYSVTFTPANSVCTAPWDSVIHVQNAALNVPGISDDYQICVTNAEIQFMGTSNNPNVTWNWTFSNGTPATSNQQNPTITFSEEGTVTATLLVTDQNGCNKTSTKDVEVHIIIDLIASEIIYCRDSSIQLNADGVDPDATYTWTATPADPNLVSTDKNPTVSPLVPTVYSVTISEGMCSTTYQVDVTPHNPASVNLPPDMVVCADSVVTLTASGDGVVFDWAKNPTFQPVFGHTSSVSVVPEKDMLIYVRSTNIEGCTAIDSMKLNYAAALVEGAPIDRKICLGDETELVVTNMVPGDNLTYNWTPSLPAIANPVVSPTQETTYHVVLTNQYGCTDDLNFHVAVISVGVNAEVTGPDTICPGMSTTLLATATGNGSFHNFLWSPASGLSSETIADPIASPNEDQVYTVTVTTENGCTATDDVTVYYISGQCVEPYIFVPAAFTPNNDSHNDFFIVRGVNIKELQFIVWDRWGEKVYETTDPQAQGWDGTFNGKDLTPDSYAWYLRATCGNGATYEKKGNVTLLK